MRKIHTLFFLLLGVFIFHVSMKLIYQFADHGKSNSIVQFAYWYNVPQFHANYSVFAPEPPDKREFFVYRGYLKDGIKTPWFEDGTTLLQQARENRFSAVYKKWKIQNYLGFQTNKIYLQLLRNPSIQHLGKNKVKEIAQQQIVHYPQYLTAARYAETKLNERNLEDIEAVEFAYLIKYVKPEKGFNAQFFPPKTLKDAD